jgi:hypothetical protein
MLQLDAAYFSRSNKTCIEPIQPRLLVETALAYICAVAWKLNLLKASLAAEKNSRATESFTR